MSDVPTSPIHGVPEPKAPTLGDRYRLVERLAIGGMGSVWKATDLVLGRTVAVKILRDDLVDSSTFLERFRNEARHTAALAHPSIASVYDYGEDRVDGILRAYLVMELVPGRALSEVMFGHGPFDVPTTLSVLAQAGDALHAAHSMGIVHRDVKPGNLMIGDDWSVKLTDFGIARAADGLSITEVGQVIGTAQYMAPEQALGEDATASSDVYALAVIGYEMLAGQQLFSGSNPAALALAHVNEVPPALPPTVPSGVRALIEAALAKDPAHRPVDAAEFAFAARRLLLEHLPPPGSLVAGRVAATDRDHEDVAATPTQVIGEALGATAVMPLGAVVVGPARLEVVAGSLTRRRSSSRRWLLVGAIAIVVAAGVAASRSSDDDFHVPGSATTTTVSASPSSVTSSPTPAPVGTASVAPTSAVLVAEVPTTTTIAAPAAGGKGKGNGKGNGKGKG